LFRTAQRHCQTNDGGGDAPDQHPDSLISRRTSKEPGYVGAERVRGANPKDYEHNTANEQSKRNDFIHMFFFQFVLI
jgi:hypothetical protein